MVPRVALAQGADCPFECHEKRRTNNPADGSRRWHRACRPSAHHHAIGMFVVTEADAAAIRAVFNQEGELSAAIELRRRFPGIIDNAEARACARTSRRMRHGAGRVLPRG